MSVQPMVNETLLDIAMSHADKLILKAQSGDEDAFNKLVGLWYKRIYNYGFKYAGSHDLAMDIAQNTFINVHTKFGQLREARSFKTWLYRIATNCCYEELRKQRKISGISLGNNSNDDDETGTMEIESDIQYRPDEKLQRQELAEIVMRGLQSLNEDQRMIVIMKEYEGLKFREIAEALEISENTAKSRLYYGLKHLRSKLKYVISDNQMEEL
ncbi:MAG: sigma-70 family RNA polymerase sigma factor [Bacteroidota bacterium]